MARWERLPVVRQMSLPCREPWVEVFKSRDGLRVIQRVSYGPRDRAFDVGRGRGVGSPIRPA